MREPPERTALRHSVKEIFALIDRSTEAKLPGGTRTDFLRPRPVTSFTNVEAMGFRADDETRGFFFNAEPGAIWPVAVGAIQPGGKSADTHLSGAQIRSVAPDQVRGLAKITARYMLRHDAFLIVAENNQLRYVSGSSLLVWMGGRWREIEVNALAGQGAASVNSRREVCKSTAALMGIALTQRYEWGVSIARPGSLSVRFTMPVSAIATVFRNRDRNVDNGRREALTNWITDHWRTVDANPEDEVYVRKHLRGANHFDWSGYSVTVLPAQYDLEKRDEFARERQLMGRQARRTKMRTATEGTK